MVNLIVYPVQLANLQMEAETSNISFRNDHQAINENIGSHFEFTICPLQM
jgi:hypothetical protein